MQHACEHEKCELFCRWLSSRMLRRVGRLPWWWRRRQEAPLKRRSVSNTLLLNTTGHLCAINFNTSFPQQPFINYIDYVASNWKVMWKINSRMSMEAAVAFLRYCTVICLECLNKITDILSYDCLPLVWESNLRPLRYEAAVKRNPAMNIILYELNTICNI
jgi:hypothetical protein